MPTVTIEYKALSWYGRNLNSIKDENTTVATYTYNSDGIRVERTASGIDTEYIYSGGKLSTMKVEDDMLYFTYDANGKVIRIFQLN